MSITLMLIAPIAWFFCWVVFKLSFFVGFLGFFIAMIGGFVIGNHLDQEKARAKLDKLVEWLKSLTGFTATSIANCSSASKLIAYDAASSKLALAVLVAEQVEGQIVDAEQITGQSLQLREVRLQNDEVKKSGFATFEVQPGQVLTFYDLTVYLVGAKWPAFALSFTDSGVANAWVGIVKGLQDGRSQGATVDRKEIAGDTVKVPSVSLVTELKELSALHESGALSHEEYAQAKSKLLGPA